MRANLATDKNLNLRNCKFGIFRLGQLPVPTFGGGDEILLGCFWRSLENYRPFSSALFDPFDESISNEPLELDKRILNASLLRFLFELVYSKTAMSFLDQV
jgi:hypothetical protein